MPLCVVLCQREGALNRSLIRHVCSQVDLVLDPFRPGSTFEFREQHHGEEGLSISIGVGEYHEHETIASSIRKVVLRLRRAIEEPVQPHILDRFRCLGAAIPDDGGDGAGPDLGVERDGINLCRSPSRCRCRRDNRQAEGRFERTLRDTLAGDPWLDQHPPVIERTGAAFGSASIDPNHRLVTTLADAADSVMIRKPSMAGVPYGCDMALWASAGGAATVVYGPGDVRHAHAADERVSLSQTASVARVLEKTARRLLA